MVSVDVKPYVSLPPEWFCTKMGCGVCHFNVTLIVGRQSHDSTVPLKHNVREKSRSGSNRVLLLTSLALRSTGQPILLFVGVTWGGHVSSWSESSSVVPMGSPSRAEDVTVYVFDKNQPSSPSTFYSVLVSISLLWPFQLCFTPRILQTVLRFLTLFSSRSGKLRTQKLKSHLVRTQSLNVLP